MTDGGQDKIEILVHAGAPSGFKDDARYRALAKGYLDLKPKRKILLHDQNHEKQQYQESPILGDNFHYQEVDLDPTAVEECFSASRSQSHSQALSPKRTHLTRSWLRSSNNLRSLSFSSALDGLESPRFRPQETVRDDAVFISSAPFPTNETQYDEMPAAGLKSPSDRTKVRAPLVVDEIPDSAGFSYQPDPEWSTESIVMEHFLSYFPISRRAMRPPSTPHSSPARASQSLPPLIPTENVQVQSSMPDAGHHVGQENVESSLLLHPSPLRRSKRIAYSSLRAGSSPVYSSQIKVSRHPQPTPSPAPSQGDETNSPSHISQSFVFDTRLGITAVPSSNKEVDNGIFEKPETPVHNLRKRQISGSPLSAAAVIKKAKAIPEDVSRIIETPPTGAAPNGVHLNRNLQLTSDEPSRILETPEANGITHTLTTRSKAKSVKSVKIDPAAPTFVEATHIQSSPVPASSRPPFQATRKTKGTWTRPQDSSTVIPPPAPTSDTTVPFTAFTPLFTYLRNKLGGTMRYKPVYEARTLRPTERGYWSLRVDDWDENTRNDTWSMLSAPIGEGKAGWGTWLTKSTEPHHHSEGGEQDEPEEWRIYCFGEVMPDIWLLIYLSSLRKAVGLGACWVDGQGQVVARMAGSKGKGKASG